MHEGEIVKVSCLIHSSNSIVVDSSVGAALAATIAAKAAPTHVPDF